MNQHDKIKRNVVIYSVAVLLLSTIGGLVTAAGNEIGGLLFILSPLLMMVLLRFFGGDGWQDAGLGLYLRGNWRWYLFSLLAYPSTMVITIIIGVLLGVTQLNGSLASLFQSLLTGFAAQLLPRTIFALFEEWGWRGYLEPRLAALNVPDLTRHLWVGSIWSIWHFPLIFSTDYTEIPYTLFLPLFVIGTLVAAIVYGQLRKVSGTVWTAVLMHGSANTVAWAIIQNNSITFTNKLLAYIAPESVVMLILWGLLAWWMLHRNHRSTSP